MIRSPTHHDRTDAGAPSPGAADAVWVGALLCAVCGAAPLPWSAALGAVAAGSLAVGLRHRAPALGSVLLAMGAAPITLSAVWAAGWSGALVLGASLWLLTLWLLMRGGAPVPRALPWAVLGLALVQGLRARLLGPEVGVLAVQGAALAVSGIVLAGLMAGARPARRTGGALALAGAALAVGAGRAALVPPDTQARLERADQWDVTGVHRSRLERSRLLGGRAIALRPRWHALATAYAERFGLHAALDQGWMPGGADLTPDERVEASRWLETRGRGGEALRLLRAGRDDPQVAWMIGLLLRVQGIEQASFDQLSRPAWVPSPDPVLSLDWVIATNGCRVLDFQVSDRPGALVLTGRGEPHPGDPRLSVQLDHEPARDWVVGPASERFILADPVAPGPHRLVVRFDQDPYSSQGDRNALVDALMVTP